MGGFYEDVEAAVLDWMLSIGTPVAPVGPFVMSLHTADPYSDGSNAELVGGSYARQTYTPNVNHRNSNTMEYTGLPAATVSHVFIWDSLGAPVMGGAFSTPITVAENGNITFDPDSVLLSAAYVYDA